jgi:membrane protein DedA with SNARE-associated domain
VGESFQALAGWLSHYGYPILFLVVFAESAGLPVPGETAVLTASVLAGRPGSPLEIGWVIVVAVVAAVLGDNLGFEIGRRWARERLAQGKRFLFLTPKALQVVEGYFDRYGTLTVFFSRFVAGLRVVCALAAGTSRMAWLRFFLANVGGAIAWAVTMSLLGYFFGQSLELLHKWLGRGALILVACIVVLAGLPYLWRHARRLPPDSWERLLRSRIWEGLVAAVLVVLCLAVLVALGERHQRWESAADEAVARWVAAQHAPTLNAVATAGSYLGSLTVLVPLAVVLAAWLWRSGRRWREPVAILGVLAVSEGVGLALWGLLRHKGIEPVRAQAWPFGFAGLGPLRGAAVYGIIASVLRRRFPAWGIALGALALFLALLIGFSVVWTREQFLSDVLVEYATGGLVLYAGLWWLEAYGVGPRPVPLRAAEPDRPSTVAERP